MFREFKVYACAVFLDCSAGKSHQLFGLGESCAHCRALESSSPGANAVPLCHETYFGFVVFKSPVYIVRRDLCCQLPEGHFYSMKLPVCIAWHEVPEGVKPPGMVWNGIRKDLTPCVCLRESFGTNLYGNSWLTPKGQEQPRTHGAGKQGPLEIRSKANSLWTKATLTSFNTVQTSFQEPLLLWKYKLNTEIGLSQTFSILDKKPY